MSNRKYKDRYVTSMPFEREVFFYLKENLPKGKDLADEINSFLKERMDMIEKEKNLNSPNYSAVTNTNIYIENKLDKYFPNHLQDWRTFKNIVNDLEDSDRIKLTEMTLSNLRILEMMNRNKTGRQVFPFLKV